ncbi:MAG: hypothetical protein KatS3mg053_0177 [Candidatus Roseilinea sp.]|nr:MAG: hypothetical protein KatS3mg053_0177 [Candidatus Roseilinea sp.]
MSKKQEFGGNWTDQKLECLRKYLEAYLMIFTKNERARFFKTIYLDAFAGTGYRLPRRISVMNPKLPFEEMETLAEDENQNLLKGSARIALELEPSFKEYIFIERDSERAKELQEMCKAFGNRRSMVIQDEANQFIKKWVKQVDWSKKRAVVFLDQYGMQVKWETIVAIAYTGAIDLWILFPIGAVNRLLTRNERPPREWGEILTRVFGSTEWQQRFYKHLLTLFESETMAKKEARFVEIGSYFVERLKSVFSGVLDQPMVLRNSRNSPLYLLCFACSNKKGCKSALNIAGDLVRRFSFAEFV